MKRFSALAALLLCLPFYYSAEAQQIVNSPVASSEITDLRLPALLDDMFMLDGRLHFSSGGMLFVASYSDGRIGDLEVDTALIAIDPEMVYAVRNLQTGSLFFTKRDSKGSSQLYEYYERKPGKYSVRHVRPARFSFAIEHPVFTADGGTMVFASDCPLGFGGSDLWYSQLRGDEWQYPQNIGHRINTDGDEKTPALYGDFLLYSSNGKEGGRGALDLYAARLVASEQTGDTVMMFPIGRCNAYSMEAPFCSPENDMAITFATNMSYGLWLVRHEALDSADRTTDRFFAFRGGLACVVLAGTVSDRAGNPLPAASVKARDSRGTITATTCDSHGNYSLFLQADEDYELMVHADDFFAFNQPVSAIRYGEEQLYAPMPLDVKLSAYNIGGVYRFDDLFRSSVTSELSPQGRAHIDSIALFLVQNPHLTIDIVSAYDLSDDLPFCSLLNQARLRSITERMVKKGVSVQAINSSSGTPVGLPPYDNRLSDDNPAAVSSRTVSFTIRKK